MDNHSMVDITSNRMSIVYERPGSDIQKAGYLKKLKVNRKKREKSSNILKSEVHQVYYIKLCFLRCEKYI